MLRDAAVGEAGPQDMQDAEAALMKLIEKPGSVPGFLEYAVEQLMDTRLAGRGGRGGPLDLLARVVTTAAARGTCSADTLACAARCLAEAGQMGAGLKVRH